MAAVGYFAPNTLNYASRVIYKAPSTSPTTTAPAFPTSRLPATGTTTNAPPPRGIPVPTTVNPIAPIQPAQPIAGGPVIITDTHLGDPLVGTSTSGGGGSSTGTSPGTTTGAGTGGGGGGGDTSRLLDLLSGAFQTQPITQGYAPQSVSSDALAPSSGGSNPGALLFLGILALVGVVWYMNRKKRAA